MGTKLDLTGQRFGKLLVITEWGKNKAGIYKWLCQCDCGKQTILRCTSLTCAGTKSCGCLIKEGVIKSLTTHGCSNRKLNGEYSSWENMKARCYYKNSKFYKDYGGRGILVCDRWLNSFANFLEDMGNMPTKKHTLERIKVNGNYDKGNCRWATRHEQSRNKRSNRLIEHNGNIMILTDWANSINMSYQVLRHHLKTKTMQEVINFQNNKNE